MDTKNTTEIDFIGLMARYLDRVNFDPEFFLTLLLECESTKSSQARARLIQMTHFEMRMHRSGLEPPA